MTKYFVPYSHDNPATIDIKGHRLIVLSTDEADLSEDLDRVGGDTIRELNIRDDMAEQTEALAQLAATVNGGVVLTPPGVSVSLMIKNLENELPWIH